MKDLTRGSISRHLLSMSLQMGAGLLLQTLYFFVDLYFVSRLGDAAIAGVSAAGTVFFVVIALTQALGVGTVALVSHAVGRQDRAEANHLFNQSVSLAVLCAAITLAGGYGFARPYMRLFGADEATVVQGVAFLEGYIPGMALQFAIVVMASALRGTGIVKPAMIVQALTVVVNAALAPVLIAGWGTGHAFGARGAGIATSLAVAVGVAVLAFYFVRLEHYVRFDRALWRPRAATWWRMLHVGVPAGAEFLLLGLFIALMYWAMRPFGAEAQAGFGIGSRINQMLFVPAMALAFAVPAVAGQNFGARQADRVRETFRVAVTCTTVVMAALTIIAQWKAELLARVFTAEPGVIAVAALYLHYVSWNFVAAGIVFCCSGLFQAMGNTWPSLGSSAFRLLIFGVPGFWLATRPGFQIRQIFMLSVATNVVQALVSVLLLRAQLRRRLAFSASTPGASRARAGGSPSLAA
ncbi:MAG TPA: MATE family efflux transporter [Usitatibacter sp.]|nr:MATE family efflux transporter [Usitatibacter sp.]